MLNVLIHLLGGYTRNDMARFSRRDREQHARNVQDAKDLTRLENEIKAQDDRYAELLATYRNRTLSAELKGFGVAIDGRVLSLVIVLNVADKQMILQLKRGLRVKGMTESLTKEARDFAKITRTHYFEGDPLSPVGVALVEAAGQVS